jgi:predicted acylesterase/phospholipase RssA
VLQRLQEENKDLRYDAIFGVSTGALTGAVLAQGNTAQSQRHYAKAVRDIYDNIIGDASIYEKPSGIIRQALALFVRGGLYSPRPLEELLARAVNPARLWTSTTHLEVGYVDLETGEYKTASGEHPDILRWILASGSQPGLFQLASPHADGGLRNMTPLADAFRYLKTPGVVHSAPPVIDILVCNAVGPLGYRKVNHKNPVQVLERTFEIVLNEVYTNDLRVALIKNEWLDDGDIYAQLHLYAPPTGLGNSLDFNPADLRRIRALGYSTPEHPLTRS